MDLDGVRLAVGEACSNAVVHAYGTGPAGTIRLRAEAGADGLVVEVADSGQGLRPRPDSPGMGLGLPLMAKLTRAIDVTHPDEGGTVVRLIF
jgi:serine/threonine-protein kinase RsbW/stage II sporulation protein AB (anti-sigma F factor)